MHLSPLMYSSRFETFVLASTGSCFMSTGPGNGGEEDVSAQRNTGSERRSVRSAASEGAHL